MKTSHILIAVGVVILLFLFLRKGGIVATATGSPPLVVTKQSTLQTVVGSVANNASSIIDSLSNAFGGSDD